MRGATRRPELLQPPGTPALLNADTTQAIRRAANVESNGGQVSLTLREFTAELDAGGTGRNLKPLE